MTIKIGFLLVFISAIALLMLSARSEKRYAIVDVNVIPMDKEQVLAHQTVLIENGKIKSITDKEKLKIPSGTTVIDGQGKYLTPGFFDMHAHFFYEQGNNINTCEAELKLMLANGLTTVRIECGDQVYLQARQNVIDNKWRGPRLYISSPQFEIGRAHV